jgi:NAD(P)-dependent dehydrogenase (short-subunit alcohol dehydrogenase family)
MEFQSISNSPNDIFSVAGKVVLITGGGRGIGLMMASAFVKGGATVYISSRKKKVCDLVADELTKIGPGVCRSIPSDLSKEEGCIHLINEFGKHENKLHVLINNAGAVWGEHIDSFPESAWDKILNLNLKGVFTVTKFALPYLRRAACPEDPARVINIGSINGIFPPVMHTFSYSSSKAGLHQLSKHLARVLASEYITVNVLAPGPFPTEMMKGTLEVAKTQVEESVPLGNRIGQPDDIAGPAIFLASKGGAYVTGAIIPVDGGVILGGKL